MSSPEHKPYVTHDDYAELTVRSVILSALLSILLASANVYLGLLVGLTVSASIPASVLSMAVLRCFPGSNILENNIVQTGASAGESLAAGVIFTLPGLVILNNKGIEGGWESFLEGGNYFYILGLAMFGGILGIAVSVPIRRALIVELKPPLKFPEGIATAQVLKAGEQGGSSVMGVLAGAVAGGVMKISETIGLYKGKAVASWFWNASADASRRVGSQFGTNNGAALYAVGYIVGPNIGIVLFAGAMLQYFLVIPISMAIKDYDESYFANKSASDVVGAEWGQTRYMGVGMMVMGGIWSIIVIRHALVQAVKFGIREFSKGVEQIGEVVPVARYDTDLSFKSLLAAIAICVVGIYVIVSAFSSNWGWTIILVLVSFCLAFLLSAVAAYMAGLVGSSNNPVSGVTICSCLLLSFLVLAMFGKGNPVGPPLVIVLCGAVASACAISGDNMQDLKSGHILGATPKKQEIIMVVGVGAASFVVAPVLEVLNKAKTIGDPNSLPAPQASLISDIPNLIINGGLPWLFIGLGIALGVCVIALDSLLAYKGIKFRIPVLALAVSFYLPIQYLTPILCGSLVHVFAGSDPEDFASDGILFAAGAIAADAITGILSAIPIAATGNSDVLLAVKTDSTILGFVYAVLLLVSMWYVSKFSPFSKRGGDDDTQVSPEDDEIKDQAPKLEI